MHFKNIFVILFLTGTVFNFVVNELLEYIDYRHRVKVGCKVPKELFGYMDSKLLKKTCEYENEKYFLFIPRHIAGFILTLVLVFSGFYVMLFNRLFYNLENIYLALIIFFLLASLPASILSLPFELYGEFCIEKKFGFSKMSIKMWILDEIKSLIIGLIISIPLLFIAIFLLLHVSSCWWILLGIVYVGFSLLLSCVYPIWIAPLFNKFSPIEDRILKSRLESLLKKTGFESKGIFMMDASKRSLHSNAYFTGFGKNKRVVLYDTLMQQLSVDEIESVLGHELGHYMHHHIIKRMCVMIPVVFVLLFAISHLIEIPDLYRGFGFSPETSVTVLENDAVVETVLPYIQFIGIFLLNLVFEGFGIIASFFMNLFSRRDEFQADRYSAEICGNSRSLETALIKLNKENLSEVTPPKVYSMIYYNHPPLLERLRALSSFNKKE
ncbi:MAG: M48 family metallopeptidase [Treponema sp.]|nr:M48 family metallopeptidase [Treponema sp.]